MVAILTLVGYNMLIQKREDVVTNLKPRRSNSS